MITEKPRLRQELEAEAIARSYKKGFGKAINPRSIARQKRYLWEMTFHWSAKKVKRALGFVNGLVFAIAKDRGAIADGKKVRRSVIQQVIHEGCRVLKTSVMGLTEYVSQWWDEVGSSSIRRLRNELSALGLFRVSGCKKYSRAWTTLMDIDFLGLLILQECLENAWIDIHSKSFDDLPFHKGGFVRQCWNAASHVLGREFNRIPVKRATQPDLSEEDAKGFGNNEKRFVAVYYENGVELDFRRCDRDGIHYPKHTPYWNLRKDQDGAYKRLKDGTYVLKDDLATHRDHLP